MKKILVILSTITLIFSLAACDAASDHTGKNTNAKTEDTIAESETIKEENEERSVNTHEELAPFNQSPTIEESILYNENNLVIHATSLTYSDYSAEISILIENNSSSEYSFSTGTIGHCANSVNGYMVTSGYMNCDVPAGKKAQESIEIDYEELQLLGINEIADIELSFEISDEDYNNIYVGPCIIKTSIAETYEYKESSFRSAITSEALQYDMGYDVVYFTEEPVFSGDKVSIGSACLIENRSGSKTLLLEVANTAETAVNFRSEKVLINNLAVYSGGNWSNDTINPGKKCVVGLDLNSVFEEDFWSTYGINEIGSLGTAFSVTDTNGNIIEKATLNVTIPSSNAVFDASGSTLYTSDTVTISYKDIREDDGNLNIFMLAKNNMDKPIIIREDYDSFSINGYMVDCSFSSLYMDPGEYAVMKLYVYEYMLEDTDIATADDIKSFEMKFTAEDERYHEYDTMLVSYSSDTTQETAGTTQSAADNSIVRTDFKAAMDAYEAFYDEYCIFMEKYKANPTDLTLLAEYAAMMTKVAEMNEAFKEWEDAELNSEEMKYYLDVNNRVAQKLIDVAV